VRDRTATPVITAAVHPCTVMMIRRLENRSATTPPRIEKSEQAEAHPCCDGGERKRAVIEREHLEDHDDGPHPGAEDLDADRREQEPIVTRLQDGAGRASGWRSSRSYQHLALDHAVSSRATGPAVNVAKELPVVRGHDDRRLRWLRARR
jgi:hypothetical protein